MAELDLDELERLAREATEGPWIRPEAITLDDEYAVGVERGDEENSSFLLVCDINEEPDNYAANARFIAASREAIPALIKRVRELKAINERDRSLVADAVAKADAVTRDYSGLLDGRGSYEYDDDRWRDEFRTAAREMSEALEPLHRVARDLSNCPRTQAEVFAARDTLASLRAENERLRATLQSALAWHESEDEALSKSGRSDSEYHWRRLQHREQCEAIRAALAGESEPAPPAQNKEGEA